METERPAYLVIDITVHDPETYAEYMRQIPPTVARYGGRYLVRGGPVASLTGNWNPERVIIIEFPSAERLREWNQSPEYQALAPLRMRSTTTRAIALQGYVTAVNE